MGFLDWYAEKTLSSVPNAKIPIKSCPFCGETALNVCKVPFSKTYAISCPGCGCMGPYGCKTVSGALYEWNKRVLVVEVSSDD